MPAFLPSELPVLCRTRHHWVTLFRLPHKYLLAAWALLLLIAIVDGSVVWWLLVIVLTGFGIALRISTWRAELVILTRKRVIRVQGIPETTSSEASLRIDRVSGARLVETVPGKLLGYGTIELEAPGDHPDVRRLVKIENAGDFYLRLRNVIFGEDVPLDPDDRPSDYVTEPLPQVRDDRTRHGRRRSS